MFLTTKPEHILAFDQASSLVKEAARQVMATKGGYLKLGDYLRNLSNIDLQLLLYMANEAVANDKKGVDTKTDDVGMNMVLLTTVLSNAEGVGYANSVEGTKQINFLMQCLLLESLSRKGLVRLHRENITFANADQELPIAEQVDKLN